jgi:hypothetical protein
MPFKNILKAKSGSHKDFNFVVILGDPPVIKNGMKPGGCMKTYLAVAEYVGPRAEPYALSPGAQIITFRAQSDKNARRRVTEQFPKGTWKTKLYQAKKI